MVAILEGAAEHPQLPQLLKVSIRQTAEMSKGREQFVHLGKKPEVTNANRRFQISELEREREREAGNSLLQQQKLCLVTLKHTSPETSEMINV